MDIYSAELQVKRLLAYVQDVANSPHKMYGKSKTRLKDVASTCSEVIRIISAILEEESLYNMDEVEFASSANADISNVLNGIQAELNKLRSFVDTSSTSKLMPTAPTKKQILYSYGEVLQSVVLKHISPAVADECAQLLHNWFISRFSGHNSNFHYNIRRLPDWIRDIVILYSYNLVSGTKDEFVSKFNEWCTSVQSDDTVTYAVPYCVYSFNRCPEASQLTLTAVVLWDILLDNGLSNLCSSADEMYPADDCIYSLCGEYNPTVLDDYVDYKLNPSILVKCKLTKD